MKANGLVAAIAVGSTLSLGIAAAPANSNGTADRTAGATTDHNPLSGYEGYCTWGAQEQIHGHTGYYIRALTGNAGDWADQAMAGGWTVVGDPQPHSIAVYSTALVGGYGHVAWVDAVDGNRITVIEMNNGPGATDANGYQTTRFHEFDTRIVPAYPGMSYILIP